MTAKPKKRLLPNLAEFAIVLLIIGALYGAFVLYGYLDRHLFVNDFEFWPIPMWSVHRSDLRDQAGNRFIADFRNNMLVVVQLPTERHPPLDHEELGEFEILLSDGKSMRFKVRPDTLIHVRPDANVDSHPLDPGEAEKLFEAIRTSARSDRMELLESPQPE